MQRSGIASASMVPPLLSMIYIVALGLLPWLAYRTLISFLLSWTEMLLVFWSPLLGR
ncbi:hypothetical protein HDV62DRAFT_360471 [Trichoderma sp. SZMC 28011]